MTQVWMHNKEIQCIEKYLSPDYNMLEWGSGGSTLHFSKLVKSYYSIEHIQEWYNKILPDIYNNTKYYYIPRQPIEEDANQSTYESFKNYIDIPFKLNTMFNFVLIDGRARRLCALRIIPFLMPNATIAIHDWVLRSPYHCVLDYYDLIEKIDDTPQTLGIFKLKSNVQNINGYTINLKTDERL
jgi:hypothetical protein